MGRLFGAFLRSIHVLKDACVIGLYVHDDVVFDSPAEEIELPNGRIDFIERDLILPSEWVKEVLREGPQLRAVVLIDVDVLVGTSYGFYDDDVMFFRVIGDEPIYETERYIGCFIDDSEEKFEMTRPGKELCQRSQ